MGIMKEPSLGAVVFFVASSGVDCVLKVMHGIKTFMSKQIYAAPNG